jgi:type II secretory pathway component PulM
MTRMIETAALWWAGREERERLLLTVLGVFVAGLVAWYGVWSPLSGMAKAAETRHTETAAALLQAEKAALELTRAQQMRGRRGVATAQAVTQSAGSAGLVVMKTEPAIGGGLTVWTEPDEPKALFGWLGGLQRELGAGVRVVEAQKEGEGVQARIVLDGAGA